MENAYERVARVRDSELVEKDVFDRSLRCGLFHVDGGGGGGGFGGGEVGGPERADFGRFVVFLVDVDDDVVDFLFNSQSFGLLDGGHV